MCLLVCKNKNKKLVTVSVNFEKTAIDACLATVVYSEVRLLNIVLTSQNPFLVSRVCTLDNHHVT